MADIFISYKREERDRCLAIHDALVALKFSVWFDARLESGTRFGAEIKRELQAAKAVLVLWSPLACESDWVQEEAAYGRQQRNLVSVRIAECEPPIGFTQTHHVDLFNHELGPKNDAWLDILGSLGKLIGRTGVEDFVSLRRGGAPDRWTRWLTTFHDDPLAGDLLQEILSEQDPALRAEVARQKVKIAELEAKLEVYQESDKAQSNALRVAARENAQLRMTLDRLNAPPVEKEVAPKPPVQLALEADVATTVAKRDPAITILLYGLAAFVIGVIGLAIWASSQNSRSSYDYAPAATAAADAAVGSDADPSMAASAASADAAAAAPAATDAAAMASDSAVAAPEEKH